MFVLKFNFQLGYNAPPPPLNQPRSKVLIIMCEAFYSAYKKLRHTGLPLVSYNVDKALESVMFDVIKIGLNPSLFRGKIAF